MLSEDEEAAASRRAIQRYPKADLDGDGSLSDSEKEQFLRRFIALRKRMNDSKPAEWWVFSVAESQSLGENQVLEM